VHISGFGGVDAGVMELDVVPQADTVLHPGWFVQMIQSDMLMMFLHSDVD
jgi:hypothetical protein